jgi:proteasome activator subunit 4
MAGRVLLACAALQFPAHLTKPVMKQFIGLLRDSTSWRVRLDVLLPLQGVPFLRLSPLSRISHILPITVFYYHHLFFLDDELIGELMAQLGVLLRDPKIEVREAAASTLSGIVRYSQRTAIASLIKGFRETLRSTKIPKRRDASGKEVEGYQDALVKARTSCVLPSPLHVVE